MQGMLKTEEKKLLGFAQVHPLVARLCGPLEGTDHARLAECLGLDSAKYHSAALTRELGTEEHEAIPLTLDADTRFQVLVRCFSPMFFFALFL